MADELRAEIAKLGGEVKTMKKEGQVKSEECQSAISKLGELRAALKEIMESEGDGDSHLEASVGRCAAAAVCAISRTCYVLIDNHPSLGNNAAD